MVVGLKASCGICNSPCHCGKQSCVWRGVIPLSCSSVGVCRSGKGTEQEKSGKEKAEVRWRALRLKSQQEMTNIGRGERLSLQRWVLEGSSSSLHVPPSPAIRRRAGEVGSNHWPYPATKVPTELWVSMRVGFLHFFAPGSYSALLGTCTELPDFSCGIAGAGLAPAWVCVIRGA